MVNDESNILQSKLQLAEQRMLSGEPNVPLTEARSRLQAKYDGSNRPNIYGVFITKNLPPAITMQGDIK